MVVLERDLDSEVGLVGQELVQRRVDQPDGDRQPVHLAKDPGEVLALHGQQRRQRRVPALVVLGDDQPLHQLAARAQEHVLGPAQPDALRAEPPGSGGVLGVVGVRADAEAAYGVGTIEHEGDRGHEVVLLHVRGALEVADDEGVGDGYGAEEHLAGGAVDRDDVALVQGRPPADPDSPLLDVDLELVGPADAGASHAPRDHGRVRRLAAAAREHPAGSGVS